MKLCLLKERLVKIVFNNWQLVAIILLSFFLRSWGTKFGMPSASLVVDETYGLTYTLRLLGGENVFLQFTGHYPMLLTFLQLPFIVIHLFFVIVFNNLTTVSQIKTYLILNGTGDLLLTPRFLSAVFGTGTILLIYKIFRILYSKHIALFGALAAGVNFISVYLSTWGKAHSSMNFFVFLSLLFTLKLQKNQKVLYLYISVISSALAISIHYLGISAVIFPLSYVIVNRKTLSVKDSIYLASLFIFIILYFYLTNLAGVIDMVKVVYLNYYLDSGSFSILPIGFLERFYYIFRDIFALDPVGLVLFLITLFVWCFSEGKNIFEKYIFLWIGVLYILQIFIVAAPQMSRWLLPISLLSSSFAFAYLTKKLADIPVIKRYKLLIPIVIIMLAPQFLLDIKWNLLLHNNTLIQTQEWIKKNLSPNYGIYSYSEMIEVPLTPNAALWNRNMGNKMAFSKKNDYIIEHPQGFYGGINLYYASTSIDVCEDTNLPNISFILVEYSNIAQKKELLKKIPCIPDVPVAEFNPISKQLKLTEEIQDAINNPISMIDLFRTDSTGNFIEIYSVTNSSKKY